MTGCHCFFQLGRGVLLKVQIQRHGHRSTVNGGLGCRALKPSSPTVDHIVAVSHRSAQSTVAFRLDAVATLETVLVGHGFSDQAAKALRSDDCSDLGFLPVQTCKEDSVEVGAFCKLLSRHNGRRLVQHVTQFAISGFSPVGSIFEIGLMQDCFNLRG